MFYVKASAWKDWRSSFDAASAGGGRLLVLSRGDVEDQQDIRVFLTASGMAELREVLPGPEEH